MAAKKKLVNPFDPIKKGTRVSTPFWIGMDIYPTVRDEFAMAALTGILSDPETKIGQPVAEYAYKMADLMLAERGKR